MPPIPIQDRIEQETIELIKKFNVPPPRQVERFVDEPQQPEVIPFVDPEPEPEPEEQGFETFAKMSKESYNNINNRKDIGKYKYSKTLSSNDFAVYESPSEYHIAVRGSNPDEPYKSFVKDSMIAMAPISGAMGGTELINEDLSKLQSKVDMLKKKKKISMSGHSLGGSIVSMFGVNNPDVDVTTFNKGEALPFISDYMKCKVYGCKNIKNYRISGDWASVIGNKFGTTDYTTLRPKFPTQQESEQAEALESVLVESDLYIPHTINQFTERGNQKLMSMNTFPRKLAQKAGRLTGAMVGAFAPRVLTTLAEQSLKKDVLTGLQAGQFVPDFEDIEEVSGQFVSSVPSSRVMKPILTGLSKFGSGINTMSGALSGYNVGGVIGSALYNQYLSVDEADY